MPTLHSNTTFDPEAKAVALITELEHEALDEHQVRSALRRIAEVFESRQGVAQERITAELSKRTEDNRADLLRAKVKGVTPAQFIGRVIQLESIIPSKH